MDGFFSVYLYSDVYCTGSPVMVTNVTGVGSISQTVTAEVSAEFASTNKDGSSCVCNANFPKGVNSIKLKVNQGRSGYINLNVYSDASCTMATGLGYNGGANLGMCVEGSYQGQNPNSAVVIIFNPL